MASLKDISKVCGVSVATVSKALNNQSDISVETRAYIKKVAKEMGYAPNLSARALKTNRTYSIGVLFVDEATSGLTHDHFASVLDSFKRTAERKGFDITFVNCCKSQEDRRPYLEHCRYRGFDGVVFACIDFTDPEVLDFVQSDIPMVTIDHIFNEHIAVISDNVGGIQQLVEYVHSKGHKKIAYIHGEDTLVTKNRLGSFYRTCERLDIEVPDEYIKKGAYRNIDATYRATRELLELPVPPTCILFSDDYAAYGGINAIKEKGLQIPEDISIAGYDGIASARYLEPKLTTVKQDAEQLGKVAASRLISLIEKPKTTLVEHIVIPVSLLEGKTVANIS